jgi:hypothetical protein
VDVLAQVLFIEKDNREKEREANTKHKIINFYLRSRRPYNQRTITQLGVANVYRVHREDDTRHHDRTVLQEVHHHPKQ